MTLGELIETLEQLAAAVPERTLVLNENDDPLTGVEFNNDGSPVILLLFG